MDLGKAFSASASLLKKNKLLIVPELLGSLFFIIIIVSFLLLSGSHSFFSDITRIESQFDEEKLSYLTDLQNLNDNNYTREAFGYATKDKVRSPYNEELDAYVDARYDVEKAIKPLLTVSNAVFIVIAILFGIIGRIYFSSLAYTLISLSMKGKGTTNLLRINNSFILRFVAFNVIISALFFIPALLVGGITALVFLVSVPLGVVLAIITFFLILAYGLLLGARLIFIEPILYLKNEPVLSAFKRSYSLTSHQVLWAMLLLFVISGGGHLIGAILAEPMYSAVYDILWAEGASRYLSILLLPVYLVLRAGATTFLNTVLFYSMDEFKGGTHG